MRVLCASIVLVVSTVVVADERVSFETLEVEYRGGIRPLLEQFCLDCHSTETKEGELDLERFAALNDVRRDPHSWQKVVEMLDSAEMPPQDNPQPSPEQKRKLRDWARRYLDAEAHANAGDPGPVVLRRLNNAEFTYTLRDLTGVEFEPAREFPVDSAAGEGFTNTGSALVMSPALVQKYLDAAKDIAAHAVLLPDGIRFSSSTSRRDWTNEILGDIRSIHLRHTGRLGDASMLNRWDVADPTKLTDEDGRVELGRYFAALMRHRARLRENADAVEAIAREEHLSAKYLRLIAEMLAADDPTSLVLNSIRGRWRSAVPDDAPAIAAEIRTWQDRLWKFNPVGHFGQVQGWQEPVWPLAESQDFRVKLAAPEEGEDDDEDVTLFLIAGSAGDGNAADAVAWRGLRIERAGRPPIRLRDVRAAMVVLESTRERALSQTSMYLAAAWTARTSDQPRDLAELAAAHGVDPTILESWLSYLGIAPGGDVKIDQYLRQPLAELAGYNFIKGWGMPGVADLSLVANSSDQKVNIPGDMNPHKIAVHPRPERWVAVGWKSPIDGRVRLVPHVQHAHAACGNGVSWSLELRRGSQHRVLRQGNVDLGGSAVVEPLNDLAIIKGDLVSLVIGPRDRNHACDLTEIDLGVSEQTGEGRSWSLSADCADSIDAGNPHADVHGNEDVWHFYSGTVEGEALDRVIPPGSLLARWLDAADAATAARLAAELEELLARPVSASTAAADADLRRQLASLGGPLFARLDYAELARSPLAPQQIERARYGLDPARFGRRIDGTAAAEQDLIVQAPSIVEIRLPAALAEGAELVTSATLDGAGPEGSVQVQVAAGKATTQTEPAAFRADSLWPAATVIVRNTSAAEQRFRRSFDQFRELFPAAMCYPKIVPVDEVVTLVLFYREDKQLSRLMLDDEEQARLDRLWDELHFVSQDALTIVTAFEQLMEFATQDSDPRKFEPLRKPIYNQADAFRQWQARSQPAQLEAVLEFASRAYRRPLREGESRDLRRLYEVLRRQEMSHDEAIRMTLARVLTAPAFLYRLETSGQSADPAPVSDWELASRLSYFLWSSIPDEQLRASASAGLLHDPDELVAQTRRMLRDPRSRRMAIEFACQWLHVRDFDQFDEKSEQFFPEFAQLRNDMYEESVRFFTDLFQNDGSVLGILDSDHTFLNETLARHYGIPDVTGDQWRRVDDVGRFSRGGILTQATILARQSGASRTSPILRGNWVAETLLGEKLPRPPKNVPQLPETVPADLTERQLIEKHSSVAACAKCHERIDPYGFALENYDAIGRLRQRDTSGHPIDARSTLMDGTSIEGFAGLRDYLLTTRRDAFLKQFCRKLLGYSLGRAVQLSDEPLLDEMMGQLAENDYHFSTAVEIIVQSKQFRMIRGKSLVVGH